jgi:Arc/MetJ-type ribon-helix-helix transcriptional regulator
MTYSAAVTPRKTTTVRIDEELLDGMQSLKERDGVPVSEQVRRAIQRWLKSKGVTVKAPRKRADTRNRG